MFATNGYVKGQTLLKTQIEATILTEKAGLHVDFITCDGAAWNRKIWRLAGINASAEVICKVEEPMDPEENLHFISDFRHLIKCLRNALVSTGFKTPEGRVCKI